MDNHQKLLLLKTKINKFEEDRKAKARKKIKIYTQEKDLKKDLKPLMKARGAKFLMVVPKGYSEGAVDFLVCYKGRFVAVETKVHTNKGGMTILQEDFLQETITAGGIGILAYHTAVVMAVFDMIDKKPNFHVNYIIHDKDVDYHDVP